MIPELSEQRVDIMIPLSALGELAASDLSLVTGEAGKFVSITFGFMPKRICLPLDGKSSRKMALVRPLAILLLVQSVALVALALAQVCLLLIQFSSGASVWLDFRLFILFLAIQSALLAGLLRVHVRQYPRVVPGGYVVVKQANYLAATLWAKMNQNVVFLGSGLPHGQYGGSVRKAETE